MVKRLLNVCPNCQMCFGERARKKKSKKYPRNKQEFNPIPGYEKYLVSRSGKIWSTYSGKIIKTRIGRERNYLYFEYTDSIKNKRLNMALHRAIALTYIEGYQKGFVVNHKDGNKKNNAVENLEWVSRKENIIHAMNMNLMSNKFGNRLLRELERQ